MSYILKRGFQWFLDGAVQDPLDGAHYAEKPGRMQ